MSVVWQRKIIMDVEKYVWHSYIITCICNHFQLSAIISPRICIYIYIYKTEGRKWSHIFDKASCCLLSNLVVTLCKHWGHVFELFFPLLYFMHMIYICYVHRFYKYSQDMIIHSLAVELRNLCHILISDWCRIAPFAKQYSTTVRFCNHIFNKTYVRLL